MADTCKTCKYFKKDTVEIALNSLVSTEFQTWINIANPESEGSTAYDIAQCSNKNVANEIISRHESTRWFFSTEKYTNTFFGQTVTGENDICAKFEAIP